MIDHTHIRKIFERYLNDNATAEEEAQLFQYIRDAQEDNNELNDLIEQVWNHQKSTLNQSDEVEQEISDIMKKVSKDIPVRKSIPFIQIAKYAASLAVICSLVYMLYHYSNNKKQTQEISAIKLESRTTAEGQKLKLILKDSTVVYLAGGSTLRWPETFHKGSNRDVYLEGEAFFEVKKDSLSPFIVHTDKLQTQVLGTSFNIYAYPDDPQFTIAVRTGKVQVTDFKNANAPRQLSLLTPGMNLAYQRKDGNFTVKNGNPVDETNAWTKNKFIFSDADLNEVLEKLERYYSVQIENKSKCRNGENLFNATFENLTIKEAMEQLQLMTGGNIQYKMIDKKTITLWRKDCR